MLQLGLEGRRLAVRDSFTPDNQSELSARDLDLGSGGPMLTPNGLLPAGGKDGKLYVLDRGQLGTKPTRQAIRFRGGIYPAPAYGNGHVYLLASSDYLSDFPLEEGSLAARPAKMGQQRFGNPGATPAISANGTRNGIVWLIETKAWNGADRPAVLHAYRAADVERGTLSFRAECGAGPRGEDAALHDSDGGERAGVCGGEERGGCVRAGGEVRGRAGRGGASEGWGQGGTGAVRGGSGVSQY